MNNQRILLVLCFLAMAGAALAQWPKDITTKNGAVITIYQPQPEKLTGNNLEGRAAFSVVETKGAEPVFGVFWYSTIISTDRDTRAITLESIKINDVKLPGVTDENKILRLKQLLEIEIPTWQLSATLDDITATIQQEQSYVSEDLKNDPPKIIYAAEPTTLVLMDGDPKLQDDKELKMKRVINSAFKDKSFADPPYRLIFS